jgi:hypothetical protein
MADISITAASVLAGTNAIKVQGIAGAAITAGQQLYLDTTTNTWKLADNDAAAAAAHQAAGTALNNAAAGQPISVQTGGDVTIGGTLTAGVVYYLSGTAGGICPVADLTSGHAVCTVGMAKSASVLTLGYQFTGVTL